MKDGATTGWVESATLPVAVVASDGSIAVRSPAWDRLLGRAPSGTATLEAALLCKPMVITYRMPRATHWLLKGKGYLPYYGLPNILAGEFVVPELIQDDATPENLSQVLLNLLADVATRERIANRFAAMSAGLQRGGARQAALAVLPFIKTGNALRR